MGLAAEVEGLGAPVGAQCEIRTGRGVALPAEVVGFQEDAALMMPLGDPMGVCRGDPVVCVRPAADVAVGEGLLGRIIDADGRPLDGGPEPDPEGRAPVFRRAPSPLDRDRLLQPFPTGIRVVDALTTCARGQRLGLLSGSGVGKSVLLGLIARHAAADVVVIALVGERGREVREFVETNLGPEGLRRAVVVVETAERPAVLRCRAAFVATAVAEHFRDRGRHVLFLMDSLTRMAMAQREIGLSIGEPPATRGYPPSVFSLLPRLVERAGCAGGGSVTGIYTVLVEGDDALDPVADAARSVLDGHLWLSRDLAARGRYPAVDPLASVSRVMPQVASESHRRAAARVMSLLARCRDVEDLVLVGAYVRGSDPEVDAALQARAEIEAFLKQEMDRPAPFEETVRDLVRLGERWESRP